MENIRYKPFKLFKSIILLFVMSLPIFGSNNVHNTPQISSSDSVSTTQNTQEEETKEVSLGSLSFLGAVILVVLSSLIGVYLLRDEFSKL